MARYAAVTFDANGTLIGVAEPVGVVYARFAAAAGLVASPAEVEARFHTALAAGPPLAFPGVSAGTHAGRERAWWRTVVHEALGHPAPDARFETCSAALFAHYAKAAAWRTFAEVPEVLLALRARGFQLAVVSNFDERLPPLLAALGIGPLVDCVIHSSAVGCAKPDPRILHAAARALAVRATDMLHIGDAPEDVAAARAAGAGAVRIDRTTARARDPERIDSLLALLQMPALEGAQP